jgi:hypothetical protein
LRTTLAMGQTNLSANLFAILAPIARRAVDSRSTCPHSDARGPRRRPPERGSASSSGDRVGRSVIAIKPAETPPHARYCNFLHCMGGSGFGQVVLSSAREQPISGRLSRHPGVLTHVGVCQPHNALRSETFRQLKGPRGQRAGSVLRGLRWRCSRDAIRREVQVPQQGSARPSLSPPMTSGLQKWVT